MTTITTSPTTTAHGTAVALPSNLPAPASAGPAAQFPDTIAQRRIHSLPGILSTTGDEREVGTADASEMIPVGSSFLPAVSAAAAQSQAGLLSDNVGVDQDAMIGVFQAHSGGYYLSPILASASDEGDMLILNAGDRVTRSSTELVAVVDASSWADLRSATQAKAGAIALAPAP